MSTKTAPRSTAGAGDASPNNGIAACFQGVSKRFGSVAALEHIDLEIRKGEFFSMLGPSGSGKTTLLRLLAGFEHPTSGRILLHGDDVTDWPPFDRDVNTVFQDYALFPHMSVADNVGYGLRVRKVAKAERTERVREALGVVQLADFGDRRPNQLSGGQRQRVALARALVNRPSMLLLDEPLGALDRRLREDMQIELKHIQGQVGITFVFVTHDQGEALTMSDRVAVMSGGRIEQVGTPTEIYERPATEFVAGFVGTSNTISGAAARMLLGEDETFAIRPEKLRITDPGAAPRADEIAASGTVHDVQYLGAATRFRVALDAGAEVIVDQQNLETTSGDPLETEGRRVQVVFRRDHARRINPTTGPDEPEQGETT